MVVTDSTRFPTICTNVITHSAISFITNCDKCYYKLRQVLLQIATCVIENCDKYYYKLRQVFMQSATIVLKCENFITKCDRYYKERLLLQSATKQTHPTLPLSEIIAFVSKYLSVILV